MARTRTLLVTGASGHLGRRVVELLVGAGADRLLLVSTDAVDFPGRRIEQHRAAIAAAKAAGVEHIIYTSFADPDPRFLVAADHWATERALAGSGLRWTVLRHNLYTEYLELLLPEAIASGH